MEVIYINDLNDIRNSEELCLALGYFDGIHLGHLQLIEECNKIAKKKNLVSSLLTFDPAPSSILNPEKYLGNINSLNDKLDIIASLGIKKVFVFHFTKQLASLTKDEFVQNILLKLKIKHIVCGFDFTYGYMGLGNAEDLKNHFELSIIEEYKVDNKKVSTTRIKNCLLNGDIQTCNKLLGYNFTIKGKVVHGLKNGRKLGYPTANINHNGYILPKKGVYACYTYVDGIKYKSMVNVGNHPTISQLSEPIIESYIFDFNEDIYGKNITIEFIDYTREEKNFDNAENLKNRLNLDTKLIAKIL